MLVVGFRGRVAVVMTSMSLHTGLCGFPAVLDAANYSETCLSSRGTVEVSDFLPLLHIMK